jgi:hypothetical protein
MRKIILALTVLVITTPALAGVVVDVNEGSEPNHVLIKYTCTDPNLVRAFGLTISADSGVIIVGEVSKNPDFYIHPSNITIEGGQITSEGSPLVAGSGPGEVYLEMGSLYAPEDPEHPTGPNSADPLVVIGIDPNGASGCTVTVTENAARGGVVMEDTDQTFDPGYVTITGSPLALTFEVQWVYPDCWGYSGTSYLGQCHGDIVDADLYVIIDDFYAFADSYDTKKADPGYNPNKTYDPCADSDKNGEVNIDDFYTFAEYYDSPVDPNCTTGDPHNVYGP